MTLLKFRFNFQQVTFGMLQLPLVKCRSHDAAVYLHLIVTNVLSGVLLRLNIRDWFTRPHLSKAGSPAKSLV
jgi:hypothetical protein